MCRPEDDLLNPADLADLDDGEVSGYCKYHHRLVIRACAWTGFKPIQYECVCTECGDDQEQGVFDDSRYRGLGDTQWEALQDYLQG